MAQASGRMPLWVRSAGSRPLMSVLLFALSTAAVLTAVLGPLLVRALDASTLREAVADPRALTSLVLATDLQEGEGFENGQTAIATSLAPTTTPAARGLWTDPLIALPSTANLNWSRVGAAKPTELVARVVATDAGCAHLRITAGRCPVRASEALLGTADARRSGTTVGDSIAFTVASSNRTRLQVVGLYDSDRFELPVTRPGTVAADLAQVTADPVVVRTAGATGLALPMQAVGEVHLRRAPSVAEVPLLRATLEAVTTARLQIPRDIGSDSGLPQLLDHVAAQVQAGQVLVLVTVVQGVGLALFALAVVLQRISQARSAEWAVGRLRGLPRTAWLASIFVEPAIAVVLGLPAGLWTGALLARTAVIATLSPGTPVEVGRGTVLATAASTTLAALVALVGVSLRSIRRPLIEVIQQSSERRGLSVAAAVAQSGVLLLAAASIYTLRAGGLLTQSGSQLGLLAPALSALAASVVAVRLAVLIVGRVTRRPPRSRIALVVGRQLARNPSALNPAIIVAVGVALAVFAGQVSLISDRNQQARAVAQTGAESVVHLGVQPGVNLLERVRAADPSGRYAMAVQERTGGSVGGAGRIVAVDASRLAAVTPRVAGWLETADLARALHPATAPPVVLRGTKVTLRLLTSSVQFPPPNGGGANPEIAPQLSLTVAYAEHWESVPLGAVRMRPGTVTADLPCPTGCRLVGLHLVSNSTEAYLATLTIAELSTDQQPATELAPLLHAPDSFREHVGQFTDPDRGYAMSAEGRPSGLHIEAHDDYGDHNQSVWPRDVDDPLPAIAARNLQLTEMPGEVATEIGVGLDGQSQQLSVVGRAPVLPRALGDGVLVDLENASGLSDPTAAEVSSEVWLAADPPPSVMQALAQRGIRVQSAETVPANRSTLAQQAVARGAAEAVWVGYAALLLTVVALIAARLAEAGRRRRDWAAIRDAGVRPAAVRWLVGCEIGVPTVLAAILGLMTGTAAVILAAPRLPLVDFTTAGPPLELEPAWLPIGVLGALTIAALVLVAAVGAFLETPRSRVRRSAR